MEHRRPGLLDLPNFGSDIGEIRRKKRGRDFDGMLSLHVPR
jgi:hypothetical protein